MRGTGPSTWSDQIFHTPMRFDHIRLFQLQLADAFSEPLLARTRFTGWNDALAYAFEQGAQQQTILILDEFLYLIRSVPGVEAMVQHLWDATTQPLWIGLCVSLLSFIKVKKKDLSPFFPYSAKIIHDK